MKYTDKKQGLYINLKAGVQKLDGDKAEQVVRFRHNSDGSTIQQIWNRRHRKNENSKKLH